MLSSMKISKAVRPFVSRNLGSAPAANSSCAIATIVHRDILPRAAAPATIISGVSRKRLETELESAAPPFRRIISTMSGSWSWQAR